MDLHGHNSNLNYKYTEICADLSSKIIFVMLVECIDLVPRVGMKFKHLRHIDFPAIEWLTDFSNTENGKYLRIRRKYLE